MVKTPKKIVSDSEPESFNAQAVTLAVTVKLPTFWSEEPVIWFGQAESQFALKGITSDDTKYHHVISSLDQATAKRIQDILVSPPPVGLKYMTLKDRLLASFTLSSYQRAKRLIQVAPLGDRTPSALLDEMLGFLGEHEPCFLFKTLFLDQLPEDVRTHLVSHLDDRSPRELALEADKLVSTLQSSINVVHTNTKSMDDNTKNKICRFHKRFGIKDFRCEGYCSFKSRTGSRNFGDRVNSVQGNLEHDHQ